MPPVMIPPGTVVSVVGGGPAGMMAAEVLATAGATVTIHEHMPSVGRKLLLAGRGGLNITHSEPLAALLGRYGEAPVAVLDAVRAFGPSDLRAWCVELGHPTVVGVSGRVFPASFRATPLLRAWIRRLVDLGVRIEVRDRWTGWADDGASGGHGTVDPRRMTFARNGAEREVHNDVAVLALGGASWPRVGSDGRWVPALRSVDVAVRDLRPSNVRMRIAWSPHVADRFAGVPLKNVAISLVDDDTAPVRGDAMITSDGIEGGPIYACSARIREQLDRSDRCTLALDLAPDLAVDQLAARWRQRRPKDSVTTALRRTLGLSDVAIAVLRESTANRVPGDADEIAALVKHVPLVVDAMMPIDRAISSAGGVEVGGAANHVDERFMLRNLPGTFVAGEMLDWDAPTGGYLLQATFSTAVAAARGAIDWLANGH